MKKKFTILIAAAVMLLTMMATTGTMWGQTREDLVLTFSLTSNPGGWPTANSTTLTNYTYTLNTVEYTFALMNVKCNSGYLMLTQPAVLGVPAIEGYKLTKIVASNSSGCSTSTKVGISSSASSPSYIGGGEIQTWSTQSSSYTYTLTSTAANTMYYIYVTNKNAQIISLALTYAPGGGGSDPTIILSESGTLNIGNYAVNTELDSRTFTVSQSNLSEGITLTATNGGTLTPNSIDLDADPTEVTWNFTTPAEAGQFTSVITATSGETSASFTYLGYAYANHNVIIAEMEHGTVIADPTSTYYYQNVTLTVTPDEGYELGTLSVVDGNNDPVTVTNNSFKMPDSDVTVSATFVVATPTTTVTDELNYDFTGISGSGYKSWEGKEGESGAIYAGNSYAGVTYIQLRTNNNNSGIVTTTSGGKVSKVTVEWAEGNTSGRSLDVYGKNSDYSSASDLYNNSNQGTKLGSIVYGTNTELTISGNYSYIGLRSANNAIYLNEIDIDWEVNGTPTPSISASNVEIAFDATGGNIAYTINNEPNPAGTLTAAIKTGTTPTITDFAIGTVTSSTVPFTCSANTTSSAHTATVTLTYTYGDNQTTTKDVVVTQAGNPDAFDNISSINSENTEYSVRGTVLAVSARGFVLGDGTGYVYYYNGYSAPSVSVGDKKIVQGTTTSYGHVIQFPSSATITATGTSNYNNTPAATVITEIPDYTSGLHLSDYFQFEGTLTKSNGYYYVSCGANNINISYPSSTQQTTMNALENKTVRVKGYFAGINSSNYFTVILESVEEVVNPVLSIEPATAADFTYVVGNGPSAEQVFEVTGTNLTSADITAAITAGTSYFEITDDTEYSSSVTIASGDAISIRLKAGLTKGSYQGTLTLSTEGASNVVVALSGTVTGATYTIESIASHGTITFDPASPVEEGTVVTLIATPAEGYDFTPDTWAFYNASTLEPVELTVTDGNKITMPTCNLAVDATFTEKPKYAITKVVTPENSGTIATDDTAWEGKEVTVLVEAASGYAFLSIVISKTDEPETTIETSGNVNDGFTFTMPGYAVTATATFISNVFEGSFIKVTTLDALEDGGYYVLYDTKAMNSTISSGKMGATVVEVVDDVITNPNRAIVWKLVKNGDNWDLFSEKEAKYCYISTTSSTSAFVMALSSFYHYNISKYDDGGFKFQTTASGGRGIGFGGNEDFRTYTSGNNPKVYLYKYTVLTERTITFDGNGGETENEETTYTQTVYDGVATNLDPNQFTFGSSIFMGWSTTQDGEVEYADEASITVNGDITLYAQWETGYTAMVDDDIDGGSVYIVTATGNEEIIEAAAGTEITLTYTADLGYAFSAWNVYYTDENEQVVPVEVNDDKFTMPAYDVTISAGFEEVTTYSLVTNIDQIVSGKHYIIVGKKNNVVKAMGYDKGNNRHAVEVSETNSTIAKTDGVYEFVINGPIVIDETNYYTIYDTNEESTGYLYAPNTSGKNYLKTQTVNDNKGQWTIGIAATSSVATIVANVSDRNTMQYNEANAIFSCYSSASQQDVYLYVKVNDNDLEYYGTEINYAQDEIPAGETITVGTGSVMTVSSTFTNTNSANLVIEDGGQLIHDTPVNATIQRNVKGYNANRDANNSGYMLIASPVSASIDVTSTNLINGTYDLYIFDESQQDNKKEWRNYKANEFTTIDNTKGYLYANESNGTISFAGELKPSTNPVTINLDYTDGNRFAGWNLVGNPFACNAYAYDTIGKSLAFFKMNTTGDGFVAVSTGAIAPMEGIFVKASEASQNFAFTKEAPVSNPGKGNLNIQVAQANTGRDAQHISDNAIIRFDGGNNLEKFSFNDYGDKLYFTLGNKDYSVFNAEARGEMPVNFKAAENGTYTIDFSMDNVEFSYLHLIDNKTGMDIDLLQTSSYTFEASKIDYASRFKLVFSTNSNSYSNDDNDFAFFDANGNLLILGNEGTATLQVIDITGRAISNETFSGNYSKAINAKAGVYMLRLIQGNDVRTQKIVVR